MTSRALRRGGLTLIRCRELAAGHTDGATPAVLRAIARTLRHAAAKAEAGDRRVTISDRMARFLAELCDRPVAGGM